MVGGWWLVVGGGGWVCGVPRHQGVGEALLNVMGV